MTNALVAAEEFGPNAIDLGLHPAPAQEKEGDI
jgi:hypothetical protein